MKYKTVRIIYSDKTQQYDNMKNFVHRCNEKQENHFKICVNITSENNLRAFSLRERHCIKRNSFQVWIIDSIDKNRYVTYVYLNAGSFYTGIFFGAPHL